MHSHLNLPYNWVNCNQLENCQELVHYPETAETLNSYPQEWVQALMPYTLIGKMIVLFDEDGDVHNFDGPAVQYEDGTLQWWYRGDLHREDGPAITHSDGTEEWYQCHELHREDEPAVTRPDGTKEWWIEGKLLREDGPLILSTDSLGTQNWTMNNKLHQKTDQQSYGLMGQ